MNQWELTVVLHDAAWGIGASRLGYFISQDNNVTSSAVAASRIVSEASFTILWLLRHA